MAAPDDRNRAGPDSAARRRWLVGALGAAATSAFGQPSSPSSPSSTRRLLVGVDPALTASGLAARLAQALAHDTGLVIEWQAAPGTALLPQLERGELDAALSHEPQLEAELLAQGLVHDHRPIAATERVLVGPAPRRGNARTPPSGDPAGVLGAAAGAGSAAPNGSTKGGSSTAARAVPQPAAGTLAKSTAPAPAGAAKDAAEALRRIAAAGSRGEAVFLSGAPAGGAGRIEEALWQAAGVAPAGTWQQRAELDPRTALALAGSLSAYTLVERGVWEAHGAGTGLALMVAGDPRLAFSYHLMRSFRNHAPAGKLLGTWLGGPGGQRAVAAFGRGYRPAG